MAGVISITDIARSINEPWQPRDLVTANDTIVRLARLEGDFPWHHHDEDELFLCWSGAFSIEMTGADAVSLSAGDIFVVPAGTEHRPVADHGPAYTLVIEKPETLQHGND